MKRADFECLFKEPYNIKMARQDSFSRFSFGFHFRLEHCSCTVLILKWLRSSSSFWYPRITKRRINHYLKGLSGGMPNQERFWHSLLLCDALHKWRNLLLSKLQFFMYNGWHSIYTREKPTCGKHQMQLQLLWVERASVCWKPNLHSFLFLFQFHVH